MLPIVANIFYVLIAIAMIVLILLQRGAGAEAGSGFGGGASATVFGARGSANFLSRSTAVLAGLFFLLSLGMGMYLVPRGADVRATDDLGVMAASPLRRNRLPLRRPAPVGEVPQPTDACGYRLTKPAPIRPPPNPDKPAAAGTRQAGAEQAEAQAGRTESKLCPDGGIGRRTTLRW